MNWSSSRGIFALLCLVGFLVILFGSWWEVSRVRRLAPEDEAFALSRQLKLRLMSAVIWLIIIAANFYAVVWLWPTAAPHTPLLKSQARLFVGVLLGAFALLIPAFILLFSDLMHTSRARREGVALRQQNMAKLLEEAAQARAVKQSGSSTRTLQNDDQ